MTQPLRLFQSKTSALDTPLKEPRECQRSIAQKGPSSLTRPDIAVRAVPVRAHRVCIRMLSARLAEKNFIAMPAERQERTGVSLTTTEKNTLYALARPCIERIRWSLSFLQIQPFLLPLSLRRLCRKRS